MTNANDNGDSDSGHAKTLDIVLPVLNEEDDLPPNTRRLHEFLSQNFSDFQWRIVIADNGSTDSTLDFAQDLSDEFPEVSFIRLEHRGRGRALRQAWTESTADIVAYMDVDLSTDLNDLPNLVAAIDQEGYDIAIGSRLIKGANVKRRPFKREFFSRGYSLTFRTMFFTGFHDAQCGFKALSREAVDELIPMVRNLHWFFDTELLILAEKNGYRIKEIPVQWTDDPDSRVKVFGTAYEDMRGLLRLRFDGFLRGLVRLRFGGLNRASQRLSKRTTPTKNK